MDDASLTRWGGRLHLSSSTGRNHKVLCVEGGMKNHEPQSTPA